ncbi:peptidoglycan DD-metalloendopeptidase family protein [Terasakiella sp. A23]|uniref:M23 family metallopeptidase n=1 Tax=Terasakiella sp. FCG-A23 TaxID=3080561 RepID=UPI0029530045|nr:peptidoglycan DD-metalloendopeptidase family protein [Terasakiella sp. A23]MDV7341446.1 peptidoglycan DD-metalloendopeptidase family protein [Terasakiella sp. A23]
MSDFEKPVKTLKQQTIDFTDKYFPERQLVLRTDGDLKYLRISKSLQMAVSACAFSLLSWTAYTTTTHFLHDIELVEKDEEILSVQVAYRSLLSEIDEYQKKFTNISDELEANHTMLIASLGTETLENKDKLVTAEAARKEAQIARKHLNNQLLSIEDSMRDLASRNYSLKGDLSLKEMDLQTALAERNTARLQKSRLEEKLRNTEIEMARLNHSQEDLIKRVSDQASEEIADIEATLTLAGLDPDKMLSNLGEDAQASGGPFIAAVSEDDDSAEGVEKAKLNMIDNHLSRWKGLQAIRQSLPLAQPLDYYYISSRYGKRRDPVNKRWAMHYGLDMAASKKSPVYVTAPGKVTFVGWKGNYGRFIVIDHGNGIETRYGHLHKTLVKKGETVDFRTKIGLVGNTGRSTGAHLHYEVRVNEKNVDPFKFIKAGRNVFQG